MGQSNSRPETPKKDKKKLKAPAEWRNDADFQVVSPMSDISNPSQFRGRQFNNQGNSTVRRNRTSKVCPKQRPPSGLPPPERFYFQGAPDDGDDIENRNKENNKWTDTMKKAKQHFSECIFQKEDEPLEEIEAEIKKRKAELKKKRHSHDPYVQFDPLIKDQRKRCMSEDVYLQHFVEPGSRAGKDVLPDRVSSDESSESFLQGRKLSLSSSRTSGSQPSMPNKQRTISHASSNGPSEVSRKSENKDVFRKPTSQVKQAEILQKPSNESGYRRRASIRRSESRDTTDELKMSVEEKFQRQIDRQTQSRVDRLRQQHKSELEKLSSSATKGRDRYTVSARERSVSAPRRKSVEVETDRRDVQGGNDDLKRAALSKRSVSAPRPSLDGSALLHLTGWKTESHTASTEQIPALLKIAGWRKEELAPHEKQGEIGSKPRADADVAAKPSIKVSDKGKALSREVDIDLKRKKEAKEVESKRTQDTAVQKLEADKSLVIKKSASTGDQEVKKHPKEASKKSSWRHSDPLPLANRSSGNHTIANILQQAYFGDLAGNEEERKPKNLRVTSDYRLLAYPRLSSAQDTNSANVSACESPAHLVSDQATNNADFLFHADQDKVLALPSKRPTTNSVINANGSRHRTNVVPKRTVVIPAPAATAIEDANHDRKVRFSYGSIPGIDNKLSDLTDDTRRDSSVAMSIPRIDSIPEEEEDEDVTADFTNKTDRRKETVDNSPQEDESEEDCSLSPRTQVKEEVEQSPQSLMKEEDEETPKNPPIMRWSYRHGDNLSKGVTPLIGGNKGRQTHTTNSPYLRFQEAKERFNTSAKVSIESKENGEEKVKPQRPNTLKRSTSLVTSRIAAMEAVAGEDQGLISKKVRRATTGREAIAPRRSKLISPALEYTNISRQKLVKQDDNIPPKLDTPTSSVVSTDSEDEFGRILHPTVIEEVSSGADSDETPEDEDSSGDEFDNLLRDKDADDEDESTLQPSVSTVRARFSMGSGMTSDNGSVSTVLQRRRLLDSMSFQSETPTGSAFSMYSNGDTASLPSMLKDEENTIPSAVQRMNLLPFREAGPVKPNETSNGTPFQARKWRALAAAASEKSLSVRNLNH